MPRGGRGPILHLDGSPPPKAGAPPLLLRWPYGPASGITNIARVLSCGMIIMWNVCRLLSSCIGTRTTYPKPSWLQTTLAEMSLKPSLQTVPHVSLWKTSKRPLRPFTSAPISLTEQRQIFHISKRGNCDALQLVTVPHGVEHQNTHRCFDTLLRRFKRELLKGKWFRNGFWISFTQYGVPPVIWFWAEVSFNKSATSAVSSRITVPDFKAVGQFTVGLLMI